MGAELLKEIVDVANGKVVKAEAFGFNDIAISRLCNYVSDVKICSSIERTESDIICLGLNYKEHVKETAKGFKDSSIDIPEYPVYFSKRAVKTIGPNDFIDSHSDITDELDYEVELAIIIGKYGSDIPKEKA